MALTDPVTGTLGLVTTMVRAGVIAPLRPDKYLRIAAAMARENMGITSGFASAAQRCPDRPGLVDELGTLTWRDIDQRADAFVFDSSLWARIVFSFAVAYKNATEDEREELMEALIPFYHSRVLSFVNKTKNHSAREAEEYLENIQRIFEGEKFYLIERWDRAKSNNGRLFV